MSAKYKVEEEAVVVAGCCQVIEDVAVIEEEEFFHVCPQLAAQGLCEFEPVKAHPFAEAANLQEGSLGHAASTLWIPKHLSPYLQFPLQAKLKQPLPFLLEGSFTS